MPSIWRDPVRLTFVDEDNRELAVVERPDWVPRAGENVRIRNRPYLVERVGYDVPEDTISAIWIVCRPA